MGPMGNAIRAVPSHPIPWDISHGNPIPMDKPAKSKKVFSTGIRTHKYLRVFEMKTKNEKKKRSSLRESTNFHGFGLSDVLILLRQSVNLAIVLWDIMVTGRDNGTKA